MNYHDVNIIVCCHKHDYYHNGPGYLPIQVGKAISHENLGFEGDDTGNNISDLNRNFCELTALYWYWKNSKITKYVGLNHYRRYFDFYGKSLSRYLRYTSSINVSKDNLPETFPNLPDLDKVFKNNDIILAKPIILPCSVSDAYIYHHIKEDFIILEDVIKELYPEYYKSFEHVMKQSNKLSPYNMFLTTDGVFNQYCHWLFNILFEVKNRIRISSYPYQARVFGFMSERLLNVFVHQLNLKVKYFPVLKISDTDTNKCVKPFLKGIIKDIRFLMSKI